MRSNQLIITLAIAFIYIGIRMSSRALEGRLQYQPELIKTKRVVPELGLPFLYFEWIINQGLTDSQIHNRLRRDPYQAGIPVKAPGPAPLHDNGRG